MPKSLWTPLTEKNHRVRERGREEKRERDRRERERERAREREWYITSLSLFPGNTHPLLIYIELNNYFTYGIH